MREWDVCLIRPDMDVYDRYGVKIGTVAHVHNLATVITATGTGERPPSDEMVVEIRTGLLGLGRHYYIPSSAIADVAEEGVVLIVARDALDSFGWQTKPTHLDERHWDGHA